MIYQQYSRFFPTILLASSFSSLSVQSFQLIPRRELVAAVATITTTTTTTTTSAFTSNTVINNNFFAAMGHSSSPLSPSSSAAAAGTTSTRLTTKFNTKDDSAAADADADADATDATTTTTTTTTNIANTNKNIVRWGIVGLGDVTQKKSGPPFWKCQGSSLVAVMRRTPGKAEAFAQRIRHHHHHHHQETIMKEEKEGENKDAADEAAAANATAECQGYDDLKEFLNHPDLQAVYVCTHPGTHLEIGRQVAEAGKALYIEKPVGRCAAETEALVDIFRKAHLPLYTAYISRAYDRTQTLKQLLMDKSIVGDRITNISYTLRGTGGARDMQVNDDTKDIPWRLDPKESGGGLIMDVGCHIIDRIDYLCNAPLEQIHGFAEQRGSTSNVVTVEDYVELNAIIGRNQDAINNAQDATVKCTWDFSITDEEESCDELIFHGSNGVQIRLSPGMSPSGPIQILNQDGQVERTIDTFDMPAHTAQKMIQAVTDDLRGVGRQEFVSDGQNALRTSVAIDTVLSEFYGGREIGYWNRIQAK